MRPVQQSRGADAGAAAATRDLKTLAATLDDEAVAAEALCEALVSLRAAVAGAEAGPLEHEVERLGRSLLTLQAARWQRGHVLAALTDDETFPLDRLAMELEMPLPSALDAARARLRRAGEAVLREATINRAVLRGALEAGDRFLQALFSAATGRVPAYGPAEQGQARATGAGVLLNRRA